MAAMTKFQSFVEAVGRKLHNLNTDVLRVALSNTAPVATQTVLDLVTNHPPPAAANGYPTGGNTPTNSGYTQTGGVGKLILVDTVFTATAGGIGPFQYVILYNDTAASNELIGFYNYGSSITLAVNETFTVDFDATNGVLTIT